MATSSSPSDRPVAKARGLERVFYEGMSSWIIGAIFIVVLMWECGILLLRAGREALWYDEVLTFHISSLHPFSLLIQALASGADGMPAAYYGIVRLVGSFPGDPVTLLRLPSLIGYLCSLLGIYWFTRRALSESGALAAVLFTAISPFRAYALEARSYALLVGFLAIAAVLWQRVDEKRWMTPLLAVFLALAVSCHHLAIVALIPFGIAECTGLYVSRKIRWGVWGAIVTATVPFLLWLPTLLQYRAAYGKTFWSKPGWGTAITTYQDYLGINVRHTLFLIVFLGLVIGVSLLQALRRSAESGKREFSAPEFMLIGGLLFFPALLAVLTKLAGSGYTSRYAWPGILGLVIGIVYLSKDWPKPIALSFLASLMIAFGAQGGNDLQKLAASYRAGAVTDPLWRKLAETCRPYLDIPVLIGSGMKYMEAERYAPEELRRRLWSVADADIATRLSGADSVDKTNLRLARYVPLRIEELKAFQTAHDRFILYSGGPYDWVTQYLLESKYQLKLVSKEAEYATYIAER